MVETTAWKASDAFAFGGETSGDIPVWLVRGGARFDASHFDVRHAAWLEAQRFTGAARKTVLLPGDNGSLSGVVFGLGEGATGDPSGPAELLTGALAQSLPPGTYCLKPGDYDERTAALAWGLGSYNFSRYRTSQASTPARPRLRIADTANVSLPVIEAVWLARDLINTPASDMGPAELEDAARELAVRHGAECTVTVGADLLNANLPMIHAVGRASVRPPRLIDIRWGREDAKRVTLVGKGITFDTGGLDIKPSSGMLLMKKDMGGAATALALAHMIMSEKLDFRLRVLLAVAENSISGDAFRPGDILTSRNGTTVEIGNTDAEGRLVLADAITLADEEQPDSIYVFATLTGAARSALGPDLPAFFTDDDELGNVLPGLAASIGDPVWRMPLWPGYRRHLDSNVADMNNVWDTPFAGAITAALFLRRFVSKARRFAHFDLYGWRSAARPLGPKGGEPQSARAVMEHLRREIGA